MKKSPSLLIILVLVLCCTVYTVKQRWQSDDNNAWKSVVFSDGYGYYAYLPCIFIYHGLDYGKTIDPVLKLHPDYSYDYINGIFPKFNGTRLDKYPIGTALLIMPFFLLAYFLSLITSTNPDGYGFLFQASVSVAALFYLALGLIYLRKLLKLYNTSEWGISITCILVVAATNLAYYSTYESSMSHVYSFGLTAFFLYYAKKAIEGFGLKHLILMAASMAVLILVRPPNALTTLMIPFLAGTFSKTKEFFGKLFTTYKTIILLAIVFVILLLQLLVWHTETGKWFIWSYTGEGFNFKNPHFTDILFSYRKGWFVYTPIMFVLLVSGLIGQFMQNKFKFAVMLLYFLITTYVLSSWWYWAYGGSYGSRPFIDYYPAFCLLPAFWHNTITKPAQKVLLILFVVVFSMVNLIQIYQYTVCIIPSDNKFMNAKIFWKMFLKTDPMYEWEYIEPPDTNDYVFDKNYDFRNNFENNIWGNNNTLTTITSRSGKHSVYLTNENKYSPTLVLHAAELPKTPPTCLYVSVWFNTSHLRDNATLVVSIRSKDSIEYFSGAKQLAPYAYEYNTWNNLNWIFRLPDFKSPYDFVKVYVIQESGTVLIDDIDVKFGTEKQ
ncbi:MAG TPA: hypothetical protein VK806_11145 [Bacteroidia bacterium]|jgi:hypothetical protein|nr:hypothetical protein [Bacteroidia bacterium]